MLYQMHEFQRALLSPLTAWAQGAAKAFVNQANPVSLVPGAQRVAAGYELLYRLGKEYEKPEFGIKTVIAHGCEVPIVEQTIIKKPFCNLIRFKRYSDDADVIKKLKDDPIVLVCAPLSGHHSTLLRDTVRTLLSDHKVYITDWIDARMVPLEDGEFHLHDYVHYIQDFIRHIGAEKLHLISVCQPTVPVLAAVSLLASNKETTPVSMTMMGGPIDARVTPTSVNSLAMNRSYEWFENNVIYTVPPNYPGSGRKVYPGFLQHTGFVAMNPDHHATAHWDYFLDLVRGDKEDAAKHVEFYDEYNAVLDMAADYYLETINTVFQEFKLPNGTWEVDGKLVRPQDIKTTALLTVEGELDDISGSGQTQAAHGLCSSIPKAMQEHYEAEGAGHYGIFSGRRWREMVYPKVRSFIKQYDDAAKAAVKAQAAKVAKAAKDAQAAKAAKAAAEAKAVKDAEAAKAAQAAKVAKEAAAAKAAKEAAAVKAAKEAEAAQAAKEAEAAKAAKAAADAKAAPASKTAKAPKSA